MVEVLRHLKNKIEILRLGVKILLRESNRFRKELECNMDKLPKPRICLSQMRKCHSKSVK